MDIIWINYEQTREKSSIESCFLAFALLWVYRLAAPEKGRVRSAWGLPYTFDLEIFWKRDADTKKKRREDCVKWLACSLLDRIRLLPLSDAVRPAVSLLCIQQPSDSTALAAGKGLREWAEYDRAAVQFLCYTTKNRNSKTGGESTG